MHFTCIFTCDIVQWIASNQRGYILIMNKLPKILYITIMLYLGYCTFMPPLFFNVLHVGTFIMLGIFAVMLLVGYLHWYDKNTTPQKEKAKKLLILLIVVGVVAETLFSVPMIYSGHYNKPTNPQSTVVVLGSSVRDDKPMQVLENRLVVAHEYLQENPDAIVVVTGGFGGGNSTLSEAQVQKNWLVENGIDESRIFVEDKSYDTNTNLIYTAEIIEEKGLQKDIVIVTDTFHQMRGQIYAQRAGLTPTGISSATPWALLPGYWLREQLAIVEAWLLA